MVAFDGARLIGTCRVWWPTGSRGWGGWRFETDARGRGAGAAILAEAERVARAAGADAMRLHAQLAALSLYERAGYESDGEVFLEEGIEHQTMERALA